MGHEYPEMQRQALRELEEPGKALPCAPTARAVILEVIRRAGEGAEKFQGSERALPFLKQMETAAMALGGIEDQAAFREQEARRLALGL